MTDLTEEERSYLDDKFYEFKIDFWKRFKIPAIGLAVVFAGLVSIFATYLYMQAKVNVMESQAEMAQAKTTFYEGMMGANKEIKDMVGKFNDLVEQAGISVEMMRSYEDEMEKLAKRHEGLDKLKPAGHPELEEAEPPITIPVDPPSLPPPPTGPSTGPPATIPNEQGTKDMFKISPQIQQQFPQKGS